MVIECFESIVKGGQTGQMGQKGYVLFGGQLTELRGEWEGVEERVRRGEFVEVGEIYR